MSYAGRGAYGLGQLLDPGGGMQVNAATDIGSVIATQNAQSEQQENAQISPYKVQAAKMQNALDTTTYNDSMIAHAAKTSTGDPDQWDQNFRALDAQGVPGARQWIGRYSPAAMDSIERGYDPAGPLARATRPSMESMSGGQGTDYDKLFSQTAPEQIPQIADRTGRAMDLLATVKDAPTWEAAKAQAAKLGIPTQGMGSYSPLKTQMLYQHLLGIHDYLSSRTADQGLGVPAPNVASKTQNVGDTLYSVNADTPSGVAEATQIAHVPESTFVGTDKASGRPVYHDTRPVPGQPADTMGPYEVNAKGSHDTTFDSKMKAWTTAHPGDDDGAMAYANGQKQMTPQEITKSALTLATGDYRSAIAAGEQISDPNAYVEQHRRQYEQDITQKNAPQSAGGNGQQRQQQYDQTATLANARMRIKQGAPRAAVIAKMKAAGLSTQGL